MLATAAVALLASLALVMAVLLLPGSGKPQQTPGSNPGGQATGQGGLPNAAVAATGGAGEKPAESTAVTGRPVAFTNPGSVPTVVAGFRSDGSLATVGTNDTAYVWDMTARQETSEVNRACAQWPSSTASWAGGGGGAAAGAPGR